jgi:hypothetical protein
VKTSPKRRQGARGKAVIKTLPPAKTLSPVQVHNVQGAKRLLSRIITQLQKDEIEDKKAKSIAYLLQVYVTIHRDSETEDRIRALEEKFEEYGVPPIKTGETRAET